nr:MAG TPA: hypothetical protein [Caudoviricetes sp.]
MVQLREAKEARGFDTRTLRRNSTELLRTAKAWH